MSTKTDHVPRHDQLHFFIDESGSFNSTRNLMLVGGVLLFGENDRETEENLRKAMIGSLAEVGKKYPNDMHFADIRQTDPAQAKRFAASLSRHLDRWRKEFDRSAYGVLIRHRHDVYDGSPGLLAERELDNRYISMLWTLIEHSVFVNDKVSRRLTDDAAIHLHIAHRVFPFPKDEEIRRFAESLNWRVVEDRNNSSRYIITSVLNEVEIRGMFRIAMRDRWKHSRRHLASINVSPIRYHTTSRSDESAPAFYLADILLGVERRRMYCHTDRQPIVVQAPLPILETLSYDRHLDALVRCKADIQNGGLDALLAGLKNNPVSRELTKELLPELTRAFKSAPEPFHRLFESASEKVDRPQDRPQGLELADLLETVYRNSNTDDLLSELYMILIPFSVANHTGDTDKANELWERYLASEKKLPSLGAEQGMEFAVQFRCRRAVSLMDQFRFSEAETILVEIGVKEENFRKKMSEHFGVDVESISRHRIGICYSTLAQACAFQSYDPQKRDMAEELFRNALNCFDKRGDLERIWVYLGHLACDFPENGRSLWDQTEENLKKLCGKRIDGLEKPFVLAVLLKGCLVFGDSAKMKESITAFDSLSGDYPDDLLNCHPYGLILQIQGLLNAALWRETKDDGFRKQAVMFFERSRKSLSLGDSLLKTLGTVVSMREYLFLQEAAGREQADCEKIMNDLRILETQLPTHPDDLAYPDEDVSARAGHLLQKIRFNYW